MLFGLLLPAYATAQARRCEYGVAPCEAYANADAVFVGEVKRIIPVTTKIWQTDDDYDQTAYVTVQQIYKGSKKQQIVLRQLGRRHAQKFISGSRYLFYANYDSKLKLWEVRPCGRTRMADYVQDDLLYLNSLPASSKRTRVSGEIVRYDTDADNPQGTTEPLAGIRLRVTGEERDFEAVTNANGVYEFYDVPPGSYTVRPRIPNGLVFLWAIHYGDDIYARARSLEIELKEGGCSGVTILLTTDKTLNKDSGPKLGRVFTGDSNISR